MATWFKTESGSLLLHCFPHIRGCGGEFRVLFDDAIRVFPIDRIELLVWSIRASGGLGAVC